MFQAPSTALVVEPSARCRIRAGSGALGRGSPGLWCCGGGWARTRSWRSFRQGYPWGLQGSWENGESVRVASVDVPQDPCGFSSPAVWLSEAVRCYIAPSCVGNAGAVQGNAAQIWKSGYLSRWALLAGGEHWWWDILACVLGMLVLSLAGVSSRRCHLLFSPSLQQVASEFICLRLLR